MTGHFFNPYDSQNLVKRNFKFLASKKLYEMLKSQVILELSQVKLMETTVLKAKTVTCIGFNVQINIYSL